MGHPDHLAATVTLPDFSRINAKLAEQLDLTFTSGQTPKVAAENVDSTIRSVLKD